METTVIQSHFCATDWKIKSVRITGISQLNIYLCSEQQGSTLFLLNAFIYTLAFILSEIWAEIWGRTPSVGFCILFMIFLLWPGTLMSQEIQIQKSKRLTEKLSGPGHTTQSIRAVVSLNSWVGVNSKHPNKCKMYVFFYFPLWGSYKTRMS